MQPLTSFDDFERFLGQFTNYERVRFFRYDRETLGLSRIRTLASRMGEPHLAYPSVHIAGTKGKGSTSLLLESLLRASGYRVGTYTSPHVEHLTDRIRLGGQPISESALLREFNSILSIIEPAREREDGTFPSFFELVTALAMGAFRRDRADWGVFEVGLGGRLDATNILEPRWTVITSIGLEHTAQLGTTLGEIAREKAGIIKPGAAVFIGPLPGEAEAVIRRVAAERGAPVVEVARDRARPEPGGTIRLQALGASVPAGPVLGPALRTDLALAAEVYRSILADDGRAPEIGAVSTALESLTLPARVEVFAGDPLVILDSAHTPDSLDALRLALDERNVPRPRRVVFALSQGKDARAVLERLSAIGDEFIFTRADEARSLPPSTLRDQFGAGEVIERPEDAFIRAGGEPGSVIVTGSFYLSGRLRPTVRRLVRETQRQR